MSTSLILLKNILKLHLLIFKVNNLRLNVKNEGRYMYMYVAVSQIIVSSNKLQLYEKVCNELV